MWQRYTRFCFVVAAQRSHWRDRHRCVRLPLDANGRLAIQCWHSLRALCLLVCRAHQWRSSRPRFANSSAHRDSSGERYSLPKIIVPAKRGCRPRVFVATGWSTRSHSMRDYVGSIRSIAHRMGQHHPTTLRE